jgi:O-methyltransferase
VAADFSELIHPLYAWAMDVVYKPNPAPIVLPLEKLQLYDEALKVIGNGPITYLEFGVYHGWSMEHITTRFTHRDARFYGFDSFIGLPEKWTNEMDRGHFTTEGKLPTIDDSRVSYIKGWFQNTVPSFLAKQRFKPPVLAHFDADLYSSTLFLLTTLWHRISEYFFIFDEFQAEEIIAMHDFTRAYPVEFEFNACTADEHHRPQQIFGRMKRVALHVS